MKVRFGEFTLDGNTRQLLRHDAPLRLSRKAFDLLAMLIERRPAVVDKATLRDRLWGDTSVVDANLNNLASEIRTVLDDDPQQPRFVRTVHRVGYAFCGTVSDERDGPARDPGTRAWLVWNDRATPLSRERTSIGRDPESDIWIDVPGVSRRHACVHLAIGESSTTATIEDLGSTNGTFVNGRRISGAVPLPEGATIRLGEAVVVFRASSTADAPTRRIRKRAAGKGSKA